MGFPGRSRGELSRLEKATDTGEGARGGQTRRSGAQGQKRARSAFKSHGHRSGQGSASDAKDYFQSVPLDQVKRFAVALWGSRGRPPPGAGVGGPWITGQAAGKFITGMQAPAW